jgi:ribosomal protein S18 acetylase RimI-like enzyme
MLLRIAAEWDLPEVVELVNLAYRGAAGWAVEAQYIEGERITLAGLREDLAAKPDALLLVWRDEDGSLLGSVWLEPYKDGAWYLGLLNVRPEMQERQLGRRLLAAAEEVAKERGARRIRMSVVNVRDTLIGWYQRRGYGLTGEREGFPYGDERFGRPLRGDLEFLILEKVV